MFLRSRRDSHSIPALASETLSQLQTRFDKETNAVRKAKLFEKLSDAQFVLIRSVEKMTITARSASHLKNTGITCALWSNF